MSTGVGETLEERVVWPDGSESTYISKKEPHRDASGRVIGLIGISHDITERKRSEAMHSQLLNLSQMDLVRLREEREIRERFVSTLTHDLRNPLTAAKMNAQLILQFPDRAESRERVAARIIASVDRADEMIQDLLDASQIRAGQALPIQIAPCEMRSMLIDVVEELTLVHGDRFVLRADQEIEGHWSCRGLRRVFENLANNAVKYGLPARPITIELRSLDQKVRISVHNDGNPLSREEQKLIFEPFRRSYSAERSAQRGWGLGLTLVRGITEAHGGRVQVQSEAGKGTTFTIEIPRDSRPAGKGKAGANDHP
jgi:signal transduction histidine kinase